MIKYLLANGFLKVFRGFLLGCFGELVVKWLEPGGGYAPVIDNVFRCPMDGFNERSKLIYDPPNDQDDLSHIHI